MNACAPASVWPNASADLGAADAERVAGQTTGTDIPTNAVSMFHALQLKVVSDRVAS
jgi:hypothetical protein